MSGMESGPLADAAVWAAASFGGAVLGDPRRTRRLVAVATALAAQPACSVARAMPSWGATKAAYRLLHQPAVSLEAVTAPHRARTMAAAGTGGVVLLVQDTSEFDFTSHRATTGLGPIGDGRGCGFLLQSVLAIRPVATPAHAQVLGVAHLEAFDRVPVPRKGESTRERRARPRESDHWLTAVERVGRPPDGAQWVLVGDRGADLYRLFATCRDQGQHLLVRLAQDRRAHDADGVVHRVLTAIRARPAGTERQPVAVPVRAGTPGRTAQTGLAWQALELQPPVGQEELGPVPGWVIRVWEVVPPEEGPPLEWLLLTTVPVTTEEEAWERVGWYRHRWVVEEYHQALKTGCRIEATQLHDQDAIWALLGICAPIAVRLLQVRMVARADPDAPATSVLPAQTVAVLAHLTQTDAAGMTARTCWRMLARLGGHLGRTRDGDPGWRTLWWGWQRLQDVLAGVRIGADLGAD